MPDGDVSRTIEIQLFIGSALVVKAVTALQQDSSEGLIEHRVDRGARRHWQHLTRTMAFEALRGRVHCIAAG